MPIMNAAYLMQSECKICWMGRNLPRQDLINSQLCNRCNHDQFHDHCNFHYHTWLHTEEMLNHGRLDENLYCQDFQDFILNRWCLNCCIFRGRILSWKAWNVNWRQLCNCWGPKNCLCSNNFSWREGARRYLNPRFHRLEEKRFEHALLFIGGPPQMYYVGTPMGHVFNVENVMIEEIPF